MDQDFALQMTRVASRDAKFDRERYVVYSIHSADGTCIEICADTIWRDDKGKLYTNFQKIALTEFQPTKAFEQQLKMFIEGMVRDLDEEFGQHSKVEPDGREDRRGD